MSAEAVGRLRSPNRKPRFRAARRQAMMDAGIVPSKRQWAWNVRPQVLKLLLLPGWVEGVRIRGLGWSAGSVWLWQVDARRLIREDRRAGGTPMVIRAELRHCPQCARPLVGADAEKRRLLNESGVDGVKQPCGVDCGRDRALRVWSTLDPYFRRATPASAPAREAA